MATRLAKARMARRWSFETILQDGLDLSLLNRVQVDVLLKIDTAVQSTPDVPGAVSRMLAERNWRTDLVAAAAAMISDTPTAHVHSLWEAFDYGSWVAPQLAVSLHLIDPEFRQTAKVRIVARCAQVDGALVRPGPRDTVVAKNLASLLQVLQQIDDERAWVDAERHASDVKQILRQDVDSAGDIATAWGESMSRALSDFRRDRARAVGPAEP